MRHVVRSGLRWSIVGLLIPSCFYSLAPAATQVVEEESVVSDEGVVDEAAERPSGGWVAVEVHRRRIGAGEGYIRQATDAFADPDQVKSLEPKYYFLLGDDPVTAPAPSLRAPATPMTLELGDISAPPELKACFPLRVPPSNTDPRADVEWIDYFAKPGPRQLAALIAPDKQGVARLVALRVEAIDDDWELKRLIASRTFKAEEMPQDVWPGGILDTFDRPAGLSAKAAMFGRMIAVLKQIGPRFAVDFFSERLSPESDCRLWLTPVGHRWGQPVALRFIELPLRRASGEVGDVSVLAVVFIDKAQKITQIALDYPLLSPPLVEQFRKMQAQPSKSDADAKASQPDLAKVLGEDVLEEFEARLVNAPYK